MYTLFRCVADTSSHTVVHESHEDFVELLQKRRFRWPDAVHLVCNKEGLILARTNWSQEQHKALEDARQLFYVNAKANTDDINPPPPKSRGAFVLPTRSAKPKPWAPTSSSPSPAPAPRTTSCRTPKTARATTAPDLAGTPQAPPDAPSTPESPQATTPPPHHTKDTAQQKA